jgi:hypothetical protein
VTSLNGLSGGIEDAGPQSATGAESGVGASDGGSSSGGGGSSSGSTSSSGGSSSGSGVGGGDPSDGGAGADGGAAADASHPVPDQDAGPSGDAGVRDSGSGGGADTSTPPGFCASLSPTPLFCDDFDEGAALAAPWDQLANTNGSEQLSATSYVSAPYAMLVSVDPNTPVTAVDVAGYKSFTSKQGLAGTATLAFEIRIDAADESSSSDGILGAIQLWNGSTYWDLELEVFYDAATNDLKVSMSEDGNTSSYLQNFASSHLPLAQWTRVTLEITLSAGTSSAAPATMALDGTTVASATVNVSTSDPIPELLIGTTFATPCAGGWSVAYDNVTFSEP